MSELRFNQGQLDRLLASEHGIVGREILRRTLAVERAAKRLLSTPGTGRVYVKSHPTRTHQASAPGQPPAVDFGRLRSSVQSRLEREGETVVGIVGTNVEYAAWLELGTSTIAPRPFLRPALTAAGGD